MFTLDVETGLKLALVEPSLAPYYFDIISRQRDYLSQWLAWPSQANDETFCVNFIKRSLHDYADGKSLTCAIIYHDELVGNMSFNSIDHELQKVEIGYWLRQDYQGKGIVTKSVARLIELAFSEFNMQKIEISAAVGNQASRGVCERLGFTLEGVLTRAENLNGRVVDHALYGLSREQWRCR